MEATFCYQAPFYVRQPFIEDDILQPRISVLKVWLLGGCNVCGAEQNQHAALCVSFVQKILGHL